MGPLGIQLLIMLVFGVVVAVVASNRGRNPVGWFAIGFAAPCLGLILVLVLPDLNVQKAKETQERDERRRLRELLSQERMKNQAFRGHATHRLDTHDSHLGIDTRTQAGDPELVPPPPPPASLAGGVPATNWYLAWPSGDSEGPMHAEELLERFRNEEITRATLVWHPSLEGWIALGDSPLGELG